MKAMTRGEKCKMHGARTAEGEVEAVGYAWASPEWGEARMAAGGAEAETKASKIASECRNS